MKQPDLEDSRVKGYLTSRGKNNALFMIRPASSDQRMLHASIPKTEQKPSGTAKSVTTNLPEFLHLYLKKTLASGEGGTEGSEPSHSFGV